MFQGHQRKRVCAGFVLCLFMLLCQGTARADQELPPSDKVLITNTAGLAAITVWGILNWDYFSCSPKAQKEGWFSEDTKEGGADKLGHFYCSYSLSHIFTYTYKSWGYTNDKAACLGALSSFAMMGFMELGDSFSDYGFSYEDFLMNLLGSAVGLLWARYPALSEKLDFRVEYTPDFDQADVFTDYDNLKFIMALKLSGFKQIQHSYARFFEFQLGYYARNYDRQTTRERNIYIGIGLSLPAIFSDLSMPRISKFFNYFQIPGTYISAGKDLNQ